MVDRITVAIAGNPNCGKSALFNSLTGSRQKVANYPGVTVEKKEGFLKLDSGELLRFVDLPGSYSLSPRSLDEKIFADFLNGTLGTADRPAVIVAVIDATCLERGISLVLELRSIGCPVLVALNLMDVALDRGIQIDVSKLSERLGVAVIPTVAVQKESLGELKEALAKMLGDKKTGQAPASSAKVFSTEERFQIAESIVKEVVIWKKSRRDTRTDFLDRLLVHPVWGMLILFMVLGLVFQAIFSWAGPLQDGIESLFSWLGGVAGAAIAHAELRSLVVDGMIQGVGSVVVFLPQILILFLFIYFLEDSGYMARAAFLMDHWMGKVGLHGRAFIPLLSSYACAIPGIMATRTIENPRDRLTTILVAPLATCSARLPVYTLLIAAFIPDRLVLGFLNLKGLVLFALYALGLLSALLAAWVMKKLFFASSQAPLVLELPSYRMPSVRTLLLGLLEKTKIFLRRAGTIILTLNVLLWFLTAYPKAPAAAPETQVESYAMQIGKWIEPVFQPIGFDWKVTMALIPGFAAREVMVSTLATVYAVENADADAGAVALGERLSKEWSLATALSLLVWYVYSPQCLSTLAVTRRETHSWKWPLVQTAYLLVLAYLASWLVFHAFS